MKKLLIFISFCIMVLSPICTRAQFGGNQRSVPLEWATGLDANKPNVCSDGQGWASIDTGALYACGRMTAIAPFSWIPIGGGSGSMIWPGGAGIPCYSGTSSWCTSYSATNTIPANYISALSYLSSTLNSADIFVGNASNVAAAVGLSGDCSLTNTGAITCTKSGGTAFGTAAFATLGNSGSDVPQLSGGLLNASVIPNNGANTTGNANTATNLSPYPTLCSGGQFSQGLSSGSNNCATPSGSGTPGGSGTNLQFRGGSSTFSGVGGSSVDTDGGINLTPTADDIAFQTVPQMSGVADQQEWFNQTTVSSPTAPTTANVTAGALASQTLYVRIVWVDYRGVQTVMGTETTQITVPIDDVLQITPPTTPPIGAVAYLPYMTLSAGASGSETLQAVSSNCTLATGLPASAPVACALGAAWTEPTTGAVTGASAPVSNLTRQRAMWVSVNGNLNGIWYNAQYQDATGGNAAFVKLFGANTPNADPYLLGVNAVGSNPTYTYLDSKNGGGFYLGTLAGDYGVPAGGVELQPTGIEFIGSSSGNSTLSPTSTGGINLGSTNATVTPGGKITTAASASGSSGFNIPQGTAPSSPNNGDIWTTSSGLFAEIAGSTVGPFGGGGGVTSLTCDGIVLSCSASTGAVTQSLESWIAYGVLNNATGSSAAPTVTATPIFTSFQLGSSSGPTFSASGTTAKITSPLQIGSALQLGSGGNINGEAAANSMIYQGGADAAASQGNSTFRGGDVTGGTTTLTAGNGIFSGGSDASSGVNSTAGNATLEAGLATAGGKQGQTELNVARLTGSALATVGEVVCQTSTAWQVAACGTGSTTWDGIAQSVGGTNTAIYVGINGDQFVVFDGTPVIGDYVCIGTTTAGYAHDNSTTACTALSDQIGKVVANVSGTGSGATATVQIAR